MPNPLESLHEQPPRLQFRVPQYLQWTASASCPSAEQERQAWVLTGMRLDCANSTVTIPVGTAMIEYPKIINALARHRPGTVSGAMSP